MDMDMDMGMDMGMGMDMDMGMGMGMDMYMCTAWTCSSPLPPLRTRVPHSRLCSPFNLARVSLLARPSLLQVWRSLAAFQLVRLVVFAVRLRQVGLAFQPTTE